MKPHKFRKNCYCDACKVDRQTASTKIIDALLKWSVANLDTVGNEFIRCHTYQSNAFPKVIRDAMKFRGHKVQHLRRAREGK